MSSTIFSGRHQMFCNGRNHGHLNIDVSVETDSKYVVDFVVSEVSWEGEKSPIMYLGFYGYHDMSSRKTDTYDFEHGHMEINKAGKYSAELSTGSFPPNTRMLLRMWNIGQKNKTNSIYVTEVSISGGNYVSERKPVQIISPQEPKPKESMNILILCNDNTANNPYNMAKTINNFFKPHKATMIYCKENYLNYPLGDHNAEKLTEQKFLEILSGVDILHLNESLTTFRYPPLGTFKNGTSIDLRKHLKPYQKVIRHSNGTYARLHHIEINQVCNPLNIYQTVSTPDLLKILPGAIWLPQPIPFHKDMYNFSPPEYDGTIRISHSPTNQQIKSTDLFLKIIDEIKKEHDNIEVRLITNTPHEKCMNLRRECHIHYDQFSLGAYGVSALEAVAMGQVCLVGLNKVEVFIPGHPFFNINQTNFKEQIMSAIELVKGKKRLEYLKKGREWVLSVHDARVVMEFMIKYYGRIGYFGR